MIILGVDTSLRSTGYGVLEVSGSQLRALEYGNIPNKPALRLSECLEKIHSRISGLVAKYEPDEISIEKVIYGKNANTMLLLGEARGAVIVACAGKMMYEYEPRRVKSSVCGNGMAEKPQVQKMIRTLLALDELPQNDAADALALAICHAHSCGVLKSEANRV